jgi:hypothetical protein
VVLDGHQAIEVNRALTGRLHFLRARQHLSAFLVGRFNLELAEEKTRLLLFGRFATERRLRSGQKAETFEFLGFKHVCGVDRGGRFPRSGFQA